MSNELTIETRQQLPTLVKIRLDEQTYPRLDTLPSAKAIADLTAVVSQAMMYRGQKTEADDIKFIAVNLYNELMVDELSLAMPRLSVAEIGIAVKRAILGSTEIYGVNVASLYRIVADYCRKEGNQARKDAEAIREQRNRNTPARIAYDAMVDAMATMLLKG